MPTRPRRYCFERFSILITGDILEAEVEVEAEAKVKAKAKVKATFKFEIEF